MEKLTPETVGIADDKGFIPNAPVIRTIAHPPNKHPKSPIRNELTAVELITPYGSRWYGTKQAWIGSELRMHINLGV